MFSENGLTLAEYKNLKRKKLKNKGLPHDFYRPVRCGLLHNVETRNGWKISRNGDLFNKTSKIINANKFMDNLIDVMKIFREQLVISDFDNDQIWTTFKARVDYLLNNC